MTHDLNMGIALYVRCLTAGKGHFRRNGSDRLATGTFSLNSRSRNNYDVFDWSVDLIEVPLDMCRMCVPVPIQI
jgi:hypothetical protein